LRTVENLVQQERLLSSALSVKKTAQSSGACRGGASFDCMHKTSTQTNERRCRYFGNGRNNIQEFSFWQEKNDEEVKRLNVTHGFFSQGGEIGGPRNELVQSRGTSATL
jgi:hypothetical protein